MLIVQHECIPQAVLGMDVLCQAKSGMGKTAVFVLATLQQLEPTENVVYGLVMCHTRELAFQISKEYERFSKYMPNVKVNIARTELSSVLVLILIVCPHRLVYSLVACPSKRTRRCSKIIALTLSSAPPDVFWPLCGQRN